MTRADNIALPQDIASLRALRQPARSGSCCALERWQHHLQLLVCPFEGQSRYTSTKSPAVSVDTVGGRKLSQWRQHA